MIDNFDAGESVSAVAALFDAPEDKARAILDSIRAAVDASDPSTYQDVTFQLPPLRRRQPFSRAR